MVVTGKVFDADKATTSGLSGTSNSLAYRVANIERTLLAGGRWFGAAVTPSGETHAADRIGAGVSAFQIDAGNADWGSWTLIIGSSDTPVDTGREYFNPHEIIITAAERTSPYFIQFARGASGADALAAGTYTEIALDTTSRAGGVIVTVQSGKAAAGTKVWARCMANAYDTGTIDFYIGITEYEG